MSNVPFPNEMTITEEKLDKLFGGLKNFAGEKFSEYKTRTVDRLIREHRLVTKEQANRMLANVLDPKQNAETFVIDSISSTVTVNSSFEKLENLVHAARFSSKTNLIQAMMQHEVNKLLENPNVGTIGRVPMWDERIGGRKVGIPREFKPTKIKWTVDRMYEIMYMYPGALGIKPDLSVKP